MKTILTVSDLPNVPAVYALYGGGERGKYVAYVGIADSLKRRIIQHLVNRDSSISTGTAAAGLNADYVKEVRWWENSHFKNRNALEASEVVAFAILNPVLRSRGKTNQKAQKMIGNKPFQKKMKKLFLNEPTGKLIIYSVTDLIHIVMDLKNEVASLKSSLK